MKLSVLILFKINKLFHLNLGYCTNFQQMSPGFPYHLTVQQEAPQWFALLRIE
jgi:hypothetical protein